MKNLLIAGLIIGLAIFGIVLYNKNMQLNRDIDTVIEIASEEANKQSIIDACMVDAYDTYTLNWSTACKSLGEGDDCLLSSSKADRLDQMYKDAQDMCITRYK
jgi:hypothetical protein